MVGDSGSSERVLVSVCLFRVRGVHFRSVVRSFVRPCVSALTGLCYKYTIVLQ